MADINDFLALSRLTDETLSEVIREGEARIQAQFQAANSADQRALAWAGFLITITLAVIGGALSLYLTKNHWPIALAALCFGLTMGCASFQAMTAARPAAFCFPGNDPKNWLPEHWSRLTGTEFNLRRARIEQAACLSNMISENAAWAKSSGARLALAMDVTYIGATFWGLVLGALVLFGFTD